MKREIGTVIASMLDAIPGEHTALRAALERLSTGARYTAPEASANDWATGASILEQHRVADESWGDRVLAIWRGDEPPSASVTATARAMWACGVHRPEAVGVVCGACHLAQLEREHEGRASL